MKTLFERKETVENLIHEKAEKFVNSWLSAIRTMSDGESKLIPEFIDSYYGYSINVHNYHRSNWIPNPNYNPNLTDDEYKLPENLKNQVGFSQIKVLTNYVNIELIENQDSWDDCAGNPEEYAINNIPEELFLNGSGEEIFEYVKRLHEKDIEREIENNFRDKWQPLFNFDISELNHFIKTMEKFQDHYDSPYRDFDNKIEALKSGL